jgi:hypothetical protein
MMRLRPKVEVLFCEFKLSDGVTLVGSTLG